MAKASSIIGIVKVRGDPHGSRSRKTGAAAQVLGGCIGCAACVDVCENVMDKMGLTAAIAAQPQIPH